MKHDPQEDDAAVAPLIRKAAEEADAVLAGEKARYVGLGWCHVQWGMQKRILREKYGIAWRTPADMNPHLAFD